MTNIVRNIAYLFSVWILRIVLLQLLWLVFNLPLVYVSLEFILDQGKSFYDVIFLLALLSPFFLFPATTALYAMVRKWCMSDTRIPVIRSFWKYYRENYVNSLLGGVFFTILWLGLIYFYPLIIGNSALLWKVFYWVISGFIFAWTIQYWSYIVHFENKFLALLKNSLILAVGSPVYVISVVLIHVAIVYISKTFPLLILLGASTISAYLSFYIFYLFIQRATMHLHEEGPQE